MLILSIKHIKTKKDRLTQSFFMILAT